MISPPHARLHSSQRHAVNESLLSTVNEVNIDCRCWGVLRPSVAANQRWASLCAADMINSLMIFSHRNKTHHVKQHCSENPVLSFFKVSKEKIERIFDSPATEESIKNVIYKGLNQLEFCQCQLFGGEWRSVEHILVPS